MNDDIDVEIGIQGENRRPLKTKFYKKEHKYWFDRQGIIQIRPRSCYKYDKEIYTCELNDWNIQLDPILYLIKGSILFDSQKEADQSQVFITQTDNEGGNKQSTLELKREYNNIYVFEYYAPANTYLNITPKAEDQSKLLFYPISKQVNVGEKCISDFNDIRFESRKGLTFKGYVEGEIKDVSIVVKSKNTGNIVHEEISPDGKYNIGPLYDTEVYEIIMTKEGYNIFRHSSKKGVFIAEILSYLTIKFIDEDTGKPIPSVLVAVSSGRTYKNSSYSDDNGVVQFYDLYSGKYYLRPLLKEFKFDTLTLDVKEGERTERTIKAKRIAFSVYGSVTLINSDPVSNIVVQAQSTTSQHVEEAITDKSGEYRIRGLHSNSKYEIRIKDSDEISDTHQDIQRSIPRNRFVEIGQTDEKDLNFMVLLPPSKFYISGYINYEDDDKEKDGGKVELFIKGKDDSPATRQKIGLSRLFTLSGIPMKGDYVLKFTPRKEPGKFYQPYEQEISAETLKKSKKDNIYINIDVPRVYI